VHTSVHNFRRREVPSAESTRLQRQINHDIHHELSTIILLASLVSTADDVGPESRARVEQIVGEARWLGELLRAAEQGRLWPEPSISPARPVRLDGVAAAVIATVRLSADTIVQLDVRETWAHVDPLAFRRALTNLVSNAVRAAGPRGEVRVAVCTVDGRALVRVDDDGPGFGAGPPGIASLGLHIVQEMTDSAGGELEIANGETGGCRVRMSLPAAMPPQRTERFAA
jgi:signal transduction histidine kinase